MILLSSSAADVGIAAQAIRDGRLVAFPTETVYGLGGDAFNPNALERIFKAKARPRFDPLILHIADLSGLDRVADLSALDAEAREAFERLSARFWPGPLTLILPRRPALPALAVSGLPTAAVRMPDHPVALALIREAGCPIAAPSANPFGRLSPTLAEHVRDQLGDRVDYIIDAGPTRVGVESTILDLTVYPPRILRPGGLSQESIARQLPCGVLRSKTPKLKREAFEQPTAPGQLASHYAPWTPLFFHLRGTPMPVESGAAYLFFDARSRDRWLDEIGALPGPAEIRTLSEEGDSGEAASRLFALLHELDRLGCSAIHAEEAPPAGLGAAINDRLRRARHPTSGFHRALSD
jgi:L-threonylcarbamoyladenylate synthase